MIRTANGDDLKCINLIRERCRQIEISEYDIKKDESNQTFVKIIDDNIVAYLTIRPQLELNQAKDAQFDVYVDPEYQKKGIGTRLIIFAAQHIENSIRFNRLTLCAHRENKTSIALYSRLGFVVAKENKFGLNHPEFVGGNLI